MQFGHTERYMMKVNPNRFEVPQIPTQMDVVLDSNSNVDATETVTTTNTAPFGSTLSNSLHVLNVDLVTTDDEHTFVLQQSQPRTSTLPNDQEHQFFVGSNLVVDENMLAPQNQQQQPQALSTLSNDQDEHSFFIESDLDANMLALQNQQQQTTEYIKVCDIDAVKHEIREHYSKLSNDIQQRLNVFFGGLNRRLNDLESLNDNNMEKLL